MTSSVRNVFKRKPANGGMSAGENNGWQCAAGGKQTAVSRKTKTENGHHQYRHRKSRGEDQ